ncbi:hypothetical protein [Mariniflexile sp. AS56]|uniref:hypothetical protein n=1 Tax=Mariniflexile sp. AS56 TaxID=3063957 RepID=UPI0026F32E7D|nr:hypothetical protein [Mariniflexile sp. AS56]MDO7172663.1 hypothetical protein [Mariniflexile sp. AS56]
MDSLKNKLVNNIEIFNNQVIPFHLKKVEAIKNNGVYNKMINWVIGEFDLYLKNESENLKVYFPNGWFSIRCIKSENNKDLLEINVEGKSRIACERIMFRLDSIYNHVVRFNEVRMVEFA